MQTKANFYRQRIAVTNIIMKKPIFILLFLCVFSAFAIGQTEKYNAPVKWEKYKISDRNVSILFPKLPVLDYSSDICSEEETGKYAAYAEGVVYGLNITYKTKQKVPAYVCTDKRKFSENNFESRLQEIKSLLKTSEETKFNQNSVEGIKIKGNLFTYWLINDFKNERWFEIWVSEEDEAKPNIKNFVESIELGKNSSGIEIGKGASRTLGDELPLTENRTDSKEINTTKTDKDEIIPARIIIKPRASYTDAARQTKVQGSVTLKVTFLASGGIGSILPVTTLPYGLTEQSIRAASRIIFVPARRNGTPYTVIKTVQYNFAIY